MLHHILAVAGPVAESRRGNEYTARRLVAAQFGPSGRVTFVRLLSYVETQMLQFGNSVELKNTTQDKAGTKIIINDKTEIEVMNKGSIGSGHPFNDSYLVARAQKMLEDPVYPFHTTSQIKNKHIPPKTWDMVSLRGKIVQADEITKRNYKNHGPTSVRDIYIKDAQGIIKAVLWDGCSNFPLVVGQQICIQDATIVRGYGKERTLSVMHNDELKVMDN